jgi:hypothetical protein
VDEIGSVTDVNVGVVGIIGIGIFCWEATIGSQLEGVFQVAAVAIAQLCAFQEVLLGKVEGVIIGTFLDKFAFGDGCGGKGPAGPTRTLILHRALTTYTFIPPVEA